MGFVDLYNFEEGGYVDKYSTLGVQKFGQPGEGGGVMGTEIPTDTEIEKMIEETEIQLRILRNLLKLNERGREKVIIYICGLTHLKKYRKA